MGTLTIGSTVKSAFHGISGKITAIKENGFMGYPEMTVSYKRLALGSASEYRDASTTFVVSDAETWQLA